MCFDPVHYRMMVYADQTSYPSVIHPIHTIFDGFPPYLIAVAMLRWLWGIAPLALPTPIALTA
jgi:hypothetical protein